MKNKKTTILLIACMIFAQRFLFQVADFDFYQFPFASSLEILQNQTGNLVLLLYDFIPIPFILFYFSERGHELTDGYGKLLIIRLYKRGWLCLKTIRTCALELFIIVFYQTTLFLFCDDNWEQISPTQIFLILSTYYLGLLAIVTLQLCLDFFIDSSYANLFTNLFFIISIFIGNCVLPSKHLSWVGAFLFPNMLFGTRNGLIQQEKIYMNYKYAIISLCSAFVLLCFIAVLKFRKKDIY